MKSNCAALDELLNLARLRSILPWMGCTRVRGRKRGFARRTGEVRLDSRTKDLSVSMPLSLRHCWPVQHKQPLCVSVAWQSYRFYVQVSAIRMHSTCTVCHALLQPYLLFTIDVSDGPRVGYLRSENVQCANLSVLGKELCWQSRKYWSLQLFQTSVTLEQKDLRKKRYDQIDGYILKIWRFYSSIRISLRSKVTVVWKNWRDQYLWDIGPLKSRPLLPWEIHGSRGHDFWSPL